MKPDSRSSLSIWLARLAVAAVVALNVSCALLFMLRPQDYAGAFELSGAVGQAIVHGFGILFVMWNVPYLPVMIAPQRQRTLFWVILAQQAIGVIGETWLWLTLPAGHAVLRATGLRFIIFDTSGLILMTAAYAFLRAVNFHTKTAKN